MGSLSLPPEFQASLSYSYDKSVETNSKNFAKEVQRLKDALPESKEWDSLKNMTKFQLSVRLLNVLAELDAIETPPDLQVHVTAVLTCEYHLYELNHMKDLKHHPILQHWVTTYASIQYALQTFDQWADPSASARMLVFKARLEIIQMALTAPGVLEGLSKWKERGRKKTELDSPRSIVENARYSAPEFIDLEPFVEMMRAQGLPLNLEYLEERYPIATHNSGSGRWALEDDVLTFQEDGQQEGHEARVEIEHGNSGHAMQDSPRFMPNHSSGNDHPENIFSTHSIPLTPSFGADPLPVSFDKGKSPVPSIFSITSRTSRHTVEQAFQADPEETTHALTRLPLDLTSLNLLTDVLANRNLTMTEANASTITREYVQHCLRIIERLGATFSPESEPDGGVDSFEVLDNMPGGREEQIRAVKLLVMFMKNLLMKGLLPVQELSFDLEEICVRFIWIKEVREFRSFLEGGDSIAKENAFLHGVGG